MGSSSGILSKLVTTHPIDKGLPAIKEERGNAKVKMPDYGNIFNVWTLEMWADPDDDSPCALRRLHCYLRDLPNQWFEIFHTIAVGKEDLALHLLVTCPASLNNDITHYHDPAKLNYKQTNYLPQLPAAATDDVIRQWGLPGDWMRMKLDSREEGSFSRKTEWDSSVEPPRAVRIGLVIHFPFALMTLELFDLLVGAERDKTATRKNGDSRDNAFSWSLALSHSFLDGRTRGLIDGIIDSAFRNVFQHILASKDYWYRHPLYIPITLQTIILDDASRELNRLRKVIRELEYYSSTITTTTTTMTSVVKPLSPRAMMRMMDRSKSVLVQLQHLKRTLKFQRALTDYLLETVADFLDGELFLSLPLQHPPPGAGAGAGAGAGGGGGRRRRRKSHPLPETYHSDIRETSLVVQRKLKDTRGRVDGYLWDCKHLQSSMETVLGRYRGKVKKNYGLGKNRCFGC